VEVVKLPFRVPRGELHRSSGVARPPSHPQRTPPGSGDQEVLDSLSPGAPSPGPRTALPGLCPTVRGRPGRPLRSPRRFTPRVLSRPRDRTDGGRFTAQASPDESILRNRRINVSFSVRVPDLSARVRLGE
jgi:hypothetical protein